MRTVDRSQFIEMCKESKNVYELLGRLETRLSENIFDDKEISDVVKELVDRSV